MNKPTICGLTSLIVINQLHEQWTLICLNQAFPIFFPHWIPIKNHPRFHHFCGFHSTPGEISRFIRLWNASGSFSGDLGSRPKFIWDVRDIMVISWDMGIISGAIHLSGTNDQWGCFFCQPFGDRMGIYRCFSDISHFLFHLVSSGNVWYVWVHLAINFSLKMVKDRMVPKCTQPLGHVRRATACASSSSPDSPLREV